MKESVRHYRGKPTEGKRDEAKQALAGIYGENERLQEMVQYLQTL